MRNTLLIILGFVDVIANVPYVVDIYKGKTKPNIAAWSTLTLINGITALAGLAAGNALNTAILGFSYLVGSLAILGLALHKGTREYTRFDAVFQLLALLGIVFWLGTNSPDIGLAAAIVVGELAAVPMYRHAYLHPDEETWSTFATASVVAAGILCLATAATFAAIAIPIDLLIGNGFMVVIILTRRSRLVGKTNKKVGHII
jgi:hypothetical protein